MTEPFDSDGPPPGPVRWRVTRLDDPKIGAYATAQTAFSAYRAASPELRADDGSSPGFGGVECVVVGPAVPDGSDGPAKRAKDRKGRSPAKKPKARQKAR